VGTGASLVIPGYVGPDMSIAYKGNLDFLKRSKSKINVQLTDVNS
jgi:hypothetical protein